MMRTVCISLAFMLCACTFAIAGDPEVKDVGPTGANTVIGGGKTTVTASCVRFQPSTTITIVVQIINQTTKLDPQTTTFTATTDSSGNLNFSGEANTPAGSTGDAASITVSASQGSNAPADDTTNAPTFK